MRAALRMQAVANLPTWSGRQLQDIWIFLDEPSVVGKHVVSLIRTLNKMESNKLQALLPQEEVSGVDISG